MPDVLNFDSDPINSEYSPYGRNYGHPLANLLGFGMFGYNYAPKPQGAQGMYDAYYARGRSKQFKNIQHDAFSSNMLFRAAGLSADNGLVSFASNAFSGPDGMAARMLSPLIGGNPMAAQMQLYAGLSGANTMGAFGQVDGVSKKETDHMMRALEKSFYKITPYKDVAEEEDKEFTEQLEKNPGYTRQLGIGVPITAEGEVDVKAQEKLKSEGARQQTSVENLVKTFDEFQLNTARGEKDYSPALAQGLSESVVSGFKELGIDKEKLAKLKTSTGELNLPEVQQAYDAAKKGVRTEEDYQQDLISEMASKMGLPTASEKRSAVLRGGVPTVIDGKAVPSALYTKDQRTTVNAATQLEAEMLGIKPPAPLDENAPAAPDNTYDNIAPATDNTPEARKTLETLSGVMQDAKDYRANEKLRKYSDPERGRLKQELLKSAEATGRVSAEELSSGVVSRETVENIQTQTDSAVETINQTSKDLDRSEITKGTKDFDDALNKALNERLKKTLKDQFKVTEEELKKNTDKSGKVDTGFVQSKLAEEKKRTLEVIDKFNKYQTAEQNKDKPEAKPGYTPQQAAQKTEEIKKILKDQFNVSDDEIKKATQKDGSLNPELIKKVTEKAAKEAGLKGAGVDPKAVENFKVSENIDKIKNNYANRLTEVNILDNIQQRGERIKGKGESAEKERQQVQVDIKQQLIAMGVSEREIAENSTKKGGFLGFGGTTEIDPEFLEAKKKEASKASGLEKAASRLEAFKKEGGKYAGINFEKTRGFNLEDFTGAFTAAADLRLLGGKDTPTVKMEQFAANSGGALSAARGLFGNKLSGGQLVGQISELLGSKAADLSSEQGSSEVEKMLRDVKAGARVAGVSIDAILGVIQSAKEVAKNNPNLRYLSSASTTDMTMKALSTVSGMSGVMSSKEFREQGGTQGMLAQNVSEQQQMLSSGLGQSLAALKYAYSGDPKKKAALDRILDKYKDKGVNGSADMNNIIKELVQQPEMAGTTVGGMYGIINSQGTREKAMRDTGVVNETQELMQKTVVNSFFKRAGNTGVGPKSVEEAAEKFKEAKKKNPELTFDQFMTDAYGEDQAQLEQFRRYGSTLTTAVMEKVDPEYYKKVKARKEQISDLDAKLDKKFAARNAPAITQIVSAIAGGDKVDDSRIKKLLNVFADTSLYKPEETQKLTAGFNTAIEAASQQDAEGAAKGLSEATGKKITKKELEQLEATGTTDSDAEGAKKSLQYLRTQQKQGKLSDTEKARLGSLETLEKLGILDDKGAYEQYKSGKGVAGVVAGSLEAEKSKKNKEQLQGFKTEIESNLAKDLQEKVTTSTSMSAEEKKQYQRVLDVYTKDGKLDTAKMMKDAQEGTGIFDANSAEGKDFDFTKGPGAEIKDAVNSASKAYEEAEEKAGSGAESKGEEIADIGSQLKKLVDALDKSKLTTCLENLSNTISRM